jgi:polar amino acid transport system permease protein
MTGSAGEFVSTAHDSDIVEEIARSRRRAKGSFRVTFTLTWVVLVGILLGSLLLAGKIDGAFIAKWAPYILGGVPITIFVSVTSIALAIILATLGALGRLSRNAVVYGVASFYVSLVRGTPLIVQLLFFYLALPQIWDGFAKIPVIALGIAALAFNYGAYMTEIFRAGIQSVAGGQGEAADALGMTYGQKMRKVVLPQAFRVIIPPTGNEFIAMMKDNALVWFLWVTASSAVIFRRSLLVG